jgi:hypothetical protein
MTSRVALALLCGVLWFSVQPVSLAQAAPQPPAQDTQIMDWVFAMPEGWRVANSRLTLLTTKLLALEHTERASQSLTQVTFGRPGTFEGTFPKWFDGHWKQLNKDYTFDAPEKPEQSDMANGYKAIAGAGVAQMPNGATRIVVLIGLNKGTQAGVMCFITEDLEHFEANTSRLDSLLTSASFASQRGKDEPAPKLKTNINPDWTPSFTWNRQAAWPKGDAPLEGIWGFQSLVVAGYDAFFLPIYRVGYRYMLFFKDGTMTTRMPPEGLLCLDVPFMRQEFPESFGTYTVKGDEVTVTTGTAESPTIAAYTRKGDNLVREAAVFKPLRTEPPALKGRWMKLGWEAHSEQYRKGITFADDGTFADEGFNSTMDLRWWCGDYYWLLEQEAEPGKGTWRVEKNTLELIYDDGRKRRYGFHMHVDEKDNSIQHPVLNSKFMTLVK